ncbi:MAG: sulfurtransferase complex subunit TusB [Pseudomonadota bacterium]
MALHLVYSIRGFSACHPRLQQEDVVVLLADGVYCAVNPTAADNTQNADLRVMTDDLEIRGLTTVSGKRIDYPDLVELCTQHTPIISWND